MPEYRYSRDEQEQVVHMLCDHYPKCFFDNPMQRRPLKKNIAADIVKDSNFQADSDRIIAAVDWYKSHISYDYALSAIGVKRIDLTGAEVGTVTEAEALEARQRAKDKGKLIAEKRSAKNPIVTLKNMHSDGKLPDDGLRKVDAPVLHKAKATTVAPELAPLYEVLKQCQRGGASH